MDIQQQDFQQEQFEIISSNQNQNNQQTWFDNVICLLQEIVISPQFQKNIHQFMKQNWSIQEQNKNIQNSIFQKYHQTFTNYLNEKLSAQIQNFNINQFFELLNDRKNQVDEQLLDTLQSLTNINSFNQFIRDYKTSHDQIQTYKVLTIKSNKIPQNKTVKGKDNIFGGAPTNPLFQTKMKKPKQVMKQQILINKTQDQLLVPDLVLTVKGFRKE